jgi:hypothetical protein
MVFTLFLTLTQNSISMVVGGGVSGMVAGIAHVIMTAAISNTTEFQLFIMM